MTQSPQLLIPHANGELQLALTRYPATQVSNLQAWDAADIHLLTHFVPEFSVTQATNQILLINDNFGALTCGLLAQSPESQFYFCHDNRTSVLGCQQNLLANQLPISQVNFLSSVDDYTKVLDPASLTLVMIKLPKNLSYFEEQLIRLTQLLPQGFQILIAAKAKLINQALLKQIEKFFGAASASLAFKNTRVITATFDGKVRQLPPAKQWQVPEYKLQISNLSNVFASQKLDIGARIMLENLPQGDFKQIIDLGCGNGVLGLRAAQLYPDATIHFVDDSAMAVASAQHNWQLNQAAKNTAAFHWDDCLAHFATTSASREELESESQVDLVLCNPPFHQGEAITDHIAWQMFHDARKHLKTGGILHIVGNRHLNYHVKLKRLFGNCQTVASNGKFVILQAVK